MKYPHFGARVCALGTALLVATATTAMASSALVYDKTDNDVVKAAKLAAASHGVASVAEAASAVKAAGKLDTLMLVGHGESGVIGLGSGTAGGYHQGKDLQFDKLADVKADLATIAAALNKGAYVIVSGCSSGGAPNGAALVENLSGVFQNDVVVVSNTQCVGVAVSGKSVCSLEGGKPWTQANLVAGENGKTKVVDRDLYKAISARLCFLTGKSVARKRAMGRSTKLR